MSNTVPQANTRTNTLAAIALVLGFVFPLLAIPVGHVARRQIARTGERGDALALIGLTFGYFWLIVLVIVLVIGIVGVVAQVVST
jgi:hypothetical protein